MPIPKKKGRKTKQGIDYFPYDAMLHMDDKLALIIAEFGFKGECLFTKLLAWIYKEDGYYTEWDEEIQLKFLGRYSYCGFSASFLQEVVPRCIKWGLFDKTVFDTFQILTSDRIQDTWWVATRKRKERIIDEEIWLIDISSGAKAEENEFIPEEIAHSKVNKKESKVDTSTSQGIGGVAAAQPKKSLEEKREEMKKRQKAFGESLIPYVEQYGKEMIRAFYNYWVEPNKSGTKFKKEMETTWDLNLRLVKWEDNQYKFNKWKKKDEQPTTSSVNEKLKAAGKEKA